MQLHKSVILVLCILLELLGLVIFLKGFFPIKAAVAGHSTFPATLEPSNPGDSGHKDDDEAPSFRPLFDRLVMVLIDALRADFVIQDSSSNLPTMKFVGELINKNMTHTYIAKAHPPTVTMPRIKALTTGGIPGFIDVVLNFDSSALQEDNVITQLKRAQKKMVFYGDDTWMRLFPEHFERSDGTTSFFVTDYTEVDNNVTRHLDAELRSEDWDVLLLHYLGLDHIGHLAGPYSPLVTPKLAEMDGVVEKIYNTLSEQDARRGITTLVLLCGDHGMSDQGSHGGSSTPEILSPLVLMSSLYEEGKGSSYNGQVVEQIDVAPTLALLMGVPIPQNSLGTSIVGALQDLPMRQRLQASYINSQQIMKVFKENVAGFEDDPGYLKLLQAEDLHRQWLHLSSSSSNTSVDLESLGHKVLQQYQRSMTSLRDRVAASLSNYDLHAMAVGVLLLWMVLISLLYINSVHDYRTTTVTSSSPLLVLIGSAGVTCSCQVVVCTSKAGSELLCSANLLSWLLSLLVIVTVAVWTTACLFTATSSNAGKLCEKAASQNSLTVFLVTGSVVHTVSLLASSFVEEEHQTWYFLSVTLHLLLGLHFAGQYLLIGNKKDAPPKLELGQEGDLNDEAYHQRQEPLADDTDAVEQFISSVRKRAMLSCVLSVAAAVVLCRVARSWNRTGDKWAHLPDVGDWLVKPDNKAVLSLLSAASLLLMWLHQLTESTSTLCKLLFAAGASAAYCFRAAQGTLSLPILYDDISLSEGVPEARVVYSIVIIMLVHALITIYFTKRPSFSGHFQRVLGLGRTSRDESNGVGYHHQRHQMVQGNNERIMANNREQQLQGRGLRTFTHDLLCAWTLLMVLVLRPHNIALVAMLVLQSACVKQCLSHLANLPVTAVTLVYLWLGQAAFYYQGNSNSLSSVDVSAGYIGVVDYSPAVIGLLMAISTYAGPIFWTLNLIVVLTDKVHTRLHDNRGSQDVGVWQEACATMLLSRALPVAVYVVLVTGQRYHLFVWSVFSPKLLYEGMHTLVVGVMISFILTLAHFFASGGHS